MATLAQAALTAAAVSVLSSTSRRMITMWLGTPRRSGTPAQTPTPFETNIRISPTRYQPPAYPALAEAVSGRSGRSGRRGCAGEVQVDAARGVDRRVGGAVRQQQAEIVALRRARQRGIDIEGRAGAGRADLIGEPRDGQGRAVDVDHLVLVVEHLHRGGGTPASSFRRRRCIHWLPGE